MKNVLILAYKRITDALRGTGIGRFHVLRKLDALVVSTIKPKEIIINGYRMILDDKDSSRLSIHGTLEPCETELFCKELKEGNTVLDIGANIGYYTLLASKKVGSKGKVYAFEPDPTNFSILKKNIEINHCENVVLVNKAVADRSERINFYLSEVNNGDHRAYASEEMRTSISIACISIDDYFKDKHENIDFIKIDIQGFECKAVRGMRGTLRNSTKTKLTAEFWPYGLTRAGDSPQELVRLLRESNFELYEINETNSRIEPINIDRLLSTYSADEKGYTNLYGVMR